MPGSPERLIRITATDAKPPEGAAASFPIEQEPERLPASAKDIAAMLRRNLAEVGVHRISGKGALSEEAAFVERLEGIMTEFYKEHASLPLERRPDLAYLASVLDGTAKEVALPPAEMRALMERVRERFGVPARSDLEMLADGEFAKGQAGRIDAHRRLVEGVTDAWQTLLAASWKEYYAEQFPARVSGEVEDLVTTDSYQYQRALVGDLSDRMSRATPDRFRKFMKALVRQTVGLKGTVVSLPELDAFAEYIAPRLPKERAIPAEEIRDMMRKAAPNNGTPLARGALTLIIEGFARDMRSVHELADPEALYVAAGEKAIRDHVREKWETFTNPQRAQFLELVRPNFVAVEPKRSEGAMQRQGKSITLREELRNHCRNLLKAIAGEKPITGKELATLGELIELRAGEIVEYRTRPEEEVAAKETEEQKSMSPRELLADVQERLSHPNAYVFPILRILMRPDMAEGRRAMMEAIRATVAKGDSKSEFASTMQQRLHRGISEVDLSAMRAVVESDGASQNKTGWELLLVAANGTHAFRRLMAPGEAAGE